MKIVYIKSAQHKFNGCYCRRLGEKISDTESRAIERTCELLMSLHKTVGTVFRLHIHEE